MIDFASLRITGDIYLQIYKSYARIKVIKLLIVLQFASFHQLAPSIDKNGQIDKKYLFWFFSLQNATL